MNTTHVAANQATGHGHLREVEAPKETALILANLNELITEAADAASSLERLADVLGLHETAKEAGNGAGDCSAPSSGIVDAMHDATRAARHQLHRTHRAIARLNRLA